MVAAVRRWWTLDNTTTCGDLRSESCTQHSYRPEGEAGKGLKSLCWLLSEFSKGLKERGEVRKEMASLQTQMKGRTGNSQIQGLLGLEESSPSQPQVVKVNILRKGCK